MKKLAIVAAVAALSSTLVVAYNAAAEWDRDPMNLDLITDHAYGRDYQCGTNDLTEGAIQGDVPLADQNDVGADGKTRAEKGYNCGLALVGHTAIGGASDPLQDGRPQTGNANMGWAGHCAYVAGAGGGIVPNQYTPPAPENGVAVVDVANPAHPKHVLTLHTPGAAATAETINAATTPDGRSILVVGRYGNNATKGAEGSEPMDVYDVSNTDCTKIHHFTDPADPGFGTSLDPTDDTHYTYDWPANIHNLTVSPDGTYVFGTIPLQAADISGLWDDDPTTGVTYVGNIQDALDGPPLATGPAADVTDPIEQAIGGTPAEGQTTHPQNMSHEAWPDPEFASNHMLYVGGQTPQYELFTIIDLTDWLQLDADGTHAGPPHVLSEQSGRAHSVRTAKINVHGKGIPYALHSEESVFGTAYGCVPENANPFAGPAQPWLTDVSDPAHPVTVSQFGLAINKPENCQEQVNSKANQSVHYHDVDNAQDTTFVMASMWNAGLRVFDVRNPRHPEEVAYFNPGQVRLDNGTLKLDQAWAHSHYDADTGEIWFTTASGGFWVVRLECQVIRHLELDVKHPPRSCPPADQPASDPGAPAREAVDLVVPGSAFIDATPYYCTLAATLPAR